MEKDFSWNIGKNNKLKEERGISFEGVVRSIIAGNFRIRKNQSGNHSGQLVYEITMQGSTWIVPFKKTKRGVFLITIFPRE